MSDNPYRTAADSLNSKALLERLGLLGWQIDQRRGTLDDGVYVYPSTRVQRRIYPEKCGGDHRKVIEQLMDAVTSMRRELCPSETEELEKIREEGREARVAQAKAEAERDVLKDMLMRLHGVRM